MKNSSATPAEAGTSANKTNRQEHKIEKDVPLHKKVSRSISMSNNPIESMGVSKASRDHNWDMESGLIFDHAEQFLKKGVNVVAIAYKPRESAVFERKADLHVSYLLCLCFVD